MKKIDEDLSLYTVRADQWDHRLASHTYDDDREFAENARLLKRTVETGGEMFTDAFLEFYKAEPRLRDEDDILDSHRINRSVMEVMTNVPAYNDLREFSMGDAFASADACVSIRETLESIWDKLELARKTQQRLQEMREQLAAEMAERMNEDAGGGNGEEDGEAQEQGGSGAGGSMSDEEVEALKQAIEDAQKQLEQEIDDQASAMRFAFSQSLEDAADEAQAVEVMNSLLWGNEQGTPTPMSYEQRKAMAKLVNNQRVREAFDLVGPMTQSLDAMNRERECEGVEEIVDIELDNDLSRVTLSEFVQLKNKYARLRFMKDYHGGNLQTYEMIGREKVARGDIIVCIDTSGSMNGQPDIWSKAVALTLLHLAKVQKRGFRGILFDTRTWEYDFSTPDQYTPEAVGSFICDFSGGGTDFVNPLNLSRQRIQENFDDTGLNNADIIMITDDQCRVPPGWLEQFKADQERLEFLTWGITIGHGWGSVEDSTLNSICDGRVMAVEDMTSGNDLRMLWKGMV